MTGKVLATFPNRIAETFLSGIETQEVLISFNANSGINATANTISTTNSNNYIKNGDVFKYFTSVGNTAPGGLSNNFIYTVIAANSTTIQLANSGGPVDLTKGLTQSGHYLSKVTPSYYFTFGKPTQWDNELLADVPLDNNQEALNFKREMLAGKKVKSTDIARMIRKVVWQANTRFDHYDDTATNLYDTDFYVLTTDSRVYKCLWNGGANNRTQSGKEPDEVTANTFSKGDGYYWKYMYTLSSANNNKFSTTYFIPIDVNTSVTSAASNGSIEIIHIDDAGLNYEAIASGTVQEVISTSIYKLETSTTSTQNSYYNTSGFYINGGAGEGQITNISNYVTNGSGHYVITESTLTGVDQTSTYKIAPQVKIEGDGTGALAYCTVNTSVNSFFVESVTVINKGQNYTYANVNIVANTSYGSNAALRAIISPPGGHGADVYNELGSKYLCISTTFSNNESNTVTTKSTFRQAGIVYDPRTYSNGSLSYTSNTFSAVTQMFVSTGVTPFTNNEIVEGLTSGAQARIVYHSPTYLEVTNLNGSSNFANGETIQGQTSASTATVSDGLARLFILTNGSNTLVCTGSLAVSNTSSIAVGQYVTGTGILPNTVITAIVADTSVGISQAANSTSTEAISFIPINNPDIDKFSGDLLFLDNFEYVTRSNTSTENIKLLINI